jgi:hypothetical protein
MDQIVTLPNDIALNGTETRVTPAPKVVQPATVVADNLKFMPDSQTRFAVFAAAETIKHAVWPAIASSFIDGAPDWDVAATGTAKERARIMGKTAREALLPLYNGYRARHGKTPDEKVAAKSLPDTVTQYLSQLCTGWMVGVSCVASIDDGVPTGIVGWTAFQTMLKEHKAKVAEDATTCLRRLLKAYESHTGSRIAPGAVAALDCLPMLAAMASALGLGMMQTLLTTGGDVHEMMTSAEPNNVAEITAPDEAVVEAEHAEAFRQRQAA